MCWYDIWLISADLYFQMMAKHSVEVVRSLARNENNITHDLESEIKKSDSLPQTTWEK